MVVCVEGRMKKGEYRKFKIRGQALGTRHSALEGQALGTGPSALERQASGPNTGGRKPVPSAQRLVPDPGVASAPVILDDFAAMHEVVLRRYRRVLEHGGPFPDLIVVDGGKGQLSAAYAALREIGLDRLIAVGIAKQEELLFTRDRVEGLALPRESAGLRLIQRIRDEAHRFAVTFHRQSRRNRDLRSELDDIAGIGARRRRQLLTTFGSVAGVRRASREELEAVVGAKPAEAVIRHFGDRGRH
jgi:excinuclease UvrABC nuclease subunit